MFVAGANVRSFSNCVHEVRTLIAQLGQFGIGQRTATRVHLPRCPLLVLPVEPKPHHAVYQGGHGHHRQAHGIPLDIPRTICIGIYEWSHDATKVSQRQLQPVRCRPLAVSRAVIRQLGTWRCQSSAQPGPGLGELTQANGKPTRTYSPRATRKQLRRPVS